MRNSTKLKSPSASQQPSRANVRKRPRRGTRRDTGTQLTPFAPDSAMDGPAHSLEDGVCALASTASPSGLPLTAFLLGWVTAVAVLLSVFWSFHAFQQRHSRLRATTELAGMGAEQLRRLLADVSVAAVPQPAGDACRRPDRAALPA